MLWESQVSQKYQFITGACQLKLEKMTKADKHPGVAENIAPDGGQGSDVMS